MVDMNCMIQMVRWSGSGQSTVECNGKEDKTEKKHRHKWWRDVMWCVSSVSVTHLFCVWHNLPHNQTTDLSSVMDNRQWMDGRQCFLTGGNGASMESNPIPDLSANGEEWKYAEQRAELNWSERCSFRKGTNNFSIQGRGNLAKNLNRVLSHLLSVMLEKKIKNLN